MLFRCSAVVLLLTLLHCQEVTVSAAPGDESPQVNCTHPKYIGPCKAALQRFYFDSEEGECKEFLFGGCRQNGNNFETKEACQEACAASDSDDDDDAVLTEAGEDVAPRIAGDDPPSAAGGHAEAALIPSASADVILTVVNPTYNATTTEEEVLDFNVDDDNTDPTVFGEWKGCEQLEFLDRPKETEEEEDQGYAATPRDEGKEVVISRSIQLMTTKEHYELEFDVRAEGFQSSAGEGAVDPANPVLELTLAEDGKEDEASSLFSIAKYGKQFEEETWKHVETTLRPTTEGNYTLRFRLNNGNRTEPASAIFLDNLRLAWQSRVPAPPPPPANETSSTTPAPGGNGTVTVAPPVVSTGSTVTETVLIILVVILVIALAALGVKHWKLKQSLAGQYNVSPPSSHSASPLPPGYVNPAFGGGSGQGDGHQPNNNKHEDAFGGSQRR